LYNGNEAGDSSSVYASQYSNNWRKDSNWKSGYPVKDEYFQFHNRYAWDGLDQGDTRRTRLAQSNATMTDEGCTTSSISFPDKLVSDTFGMLPRGAKAPDSSFGDGGTSGKDFSTCTPSKLPSASYQDLSSTRKAWIPYADWNVFVNKTALRKEDGSPIPTTTTQVPGPTKKGFPAQVDGVLYAEGCIAGANFEKTVVPKFHGSFISNDTHYISCYKSKSEGNGWSDSNTMTEIYLDNRADSTFMGFPNEIQFIVTGYQVKGSSSSEFDSY
ncbi:MAG: hypothetical protein ABRQ37_23720, partial [Candidatus Eremiobacterota bacterium]